MRTFDHPNFINGWKCQVCGTAADRPVTLVPMCETEHQGVVEAQQVHVQCFELLSEMDAAERIRATALEAGI